MPCAGEPSGWNWWGWGGIRTFSARALFRETWGSRFRWSLHPRLGFVVAPSALLRWMGFSPLALLLWVAGALVVRFVKDASGYRRP